MKNTLGRLQAVGGQWDDDGYAVLHVTTRQKYVGVEQLKTLQAIIDAGLAAIQFPTHADEAAPLFALAQQ
ncbi:hypothetical protein ACC761_06295 [Rhizobium ruizarguesonis]